MTPCLPDFDGELVSSEAREALLAHNKLDPNKKYVLVANDEATFRTHETCQQGWVDQDTMLGNVVPAKDKGRAYMVGAFWDEENGELCPSMILVRALA
jgi:hypothetical protein